MATLTIKINRIVDLSDEQFYQLCQENQDLKFERNAKGELIIMSPTGSATGRSNADLIVQLGIWNRETKLGVVFDSSTGFKLPNSADRSPDAAWVKRDKWESLTPEQKRRFAPICPDFVVELCSPSDELQKVQKKLQEYLENGASLGWLIEPDTRRVEIYRPNQPAEVLENPTSLSGETVLPGFVLDLQSIFED